MIFVFESLVGDRGSAQFGAILHKIRERDMSGFPREVELWFWVDLAGLYATVGQEFDMWYGGRTTGRGRVTAELNES